MYETIKGEYGDSAAWIEKGEPFYSRSQVAAWRETLREDMQRLGFTIK
jgi:hypothetical protein